MSESNKDLESEVFELLFGDLTPDEQAIIKRQLSGDHGLDGEGEKIPPIAPYSKKCTPEQFEAALQPLSCEHMAAHYGGEAWDWVEFDEFRYLLAQHYSGGTQTYSWWERYTVVAEFGGGVTCCPILYPHHDDDDQGVEITNTMNWSDGHYNACVFGVFITIMALTMLAEKLYPHNEQRGMVYYHLRNAVIASFKDGYCYGIGDNEIVELHKLID